MVAVVESTAAGLKDSVDAAGTTVPPSDYVVVREEGRPVVFEPDETAERPDLDEATLQKAFTVVVIEVLDLKSSNQMSMVQNFRD